MAILVTLQFSPRPSTVCYQAHGGILGNNELYTCNLSRVCGHLDIAELEGTLDSYTQDTPAGHAQQNLLAS